jgi:hypothetical protein
MEKGIELMDKRIENLTVDLEGFLQSEQSAPANRILKLIELRKALRAYIE